MIKIYFITFFISELIIAFAIIIKILQLDKRVNELNAIILANQDKIKSIFTTSRLFFENFVDHYEKLRAALIQKRTEYIINFVKTALVYFGLVFSKGKYRNAILAYQLIREVYCELNEDEI